MGAGATAEGENASLYAMTATVRILQPEQRLLIKSRAKSGTEGFSPLLSPTPRWGSGMHQVSPLTTSGRAALLPTCSSGREEICLTHFMWLIKALTRHFLVVLFLFLNLDGLSSNHTCSTGSFLHGHVK